MSSSPVQPMIVSGVSTCTVRRMSTLSASRSMFAKARVRSSSPFGMARSLWTAMTVRMSSSSLASSR